ncbi:Uma2 family endonuclease [Microcystis aeruginosa CS-1036]|jgi:Uma2 family endonuclease|uniref:Uma2 family endonuclease n=1 Tax=Microcystis TaxID=1125 RepID=UPI000261ADC8|nr:MULTISPECIES: Uma2 family endonuclease [Microcystis]NCR96620.1 Uma2 family endonuclease [Microcystis aeruginosa L311-01]TRU09935.1 MAG: Uma2 family endonuclease [Microcystis aeruginosa Ma_MB_F_20061100_S19D]TRU17835.1 MAG: Uma2 family endonuclease [Microcystis aeruginosa Ma_MB_F_20061100_S19]MDB9403036.1 Uma2 family endonuclease [Microcystis sp. CS-574]MDB9542214.1 Uma2 family endonuclease [Microcystis aeruginosa CS-1036]
MLSATETKYYTPEEYLALEETSEDKNEYRQGEIIPMVGATTNHNQIAGNFYRRFPLTINNQDYYTYMETVRLWLSDYSIYTYPDVMVIKGQPLYQGNSQSNVINPLIIVEVLSNSTQAYDRGDKFKFYRSLPTFQEYILIEQSSYSVERYYKQKDDQWLIDFVMGENAVLQLVSVDWQISLQDLYQRVNFDLAET